MTEQVPDWADGRIKQRIEAWMIRAFLFDMYERANQEGVDVSNLLPAFQFIP